MGKRLYLIEYVHYKLYLMTDLRHLANYIILIIFVL